MKKILPICESPQCLDLHTSAFPLSILNADSRFSERWLIQNLIPIEYAKRYGNVLTYDLPLFWFWKCFNFKISLHYPGKDVIKTICKRIEQGYYVFLCVNEKYIPERAAYQLYNFKHEILIYGFCDEDQTFYTIAYNRHQDYMPQRIPMNVLYKAFIRNRIEHFFKFYPLKVVESYHFDAFDVHQIKRDIDQYLNPKQDNKGYKAFEKLKRNVLKGGEMKNDIDLRSFRTLRDRSQIFLLIQKYFQVSSEFNQLLYDNLQLCRNTFGIVIKYNMTKDNVLFQRINENLNAISQMEIKILIQLKDAL